MRSLPSTVYLETSYISQDDRFAALQIDLASKGGRGGRLTRSSLTLSDQFLNYSISGSCGWIPRPFDEKKYTTHLVRASMGFRLSTFHETWRTNTAKLESDDPKGRIGLPTHASLRRQHLRQTIASPFRCPETGGDIVRP